MSHINSLGCNGKNRNPKGHVFVLLAKAGTLVQFCMFMCPVSSPSLNCWGRWANTKAKPSESQVWLTVGWLDYSVYSSVNSLKSKFAAVYLELRAADECMEGFFRLNISSISFINQTVSQAATSRILQPCTGPIFHLLCFVWDLQCSFFSLNHWYMQCVTCLCTVNCLTLTLMSIHMMQ